MTQPHFGIYNWEGGAFGVALTSTSITAVGKDGCDAVRIEGQPPAWVVDGVAKLLANKAGVDRPASTLANVELSLHGFSVPDEDGNRRRVSGFNLLNRDASEADILEAWEGLSRQVEGMLDDLRDASPQKRPRPECTWTAEVEMLLGIAESACPPDHDYDLGMDAEFPARDGWRVSFFYDVGDLDYIEQFTSPDGTVIDFWDWPDDAPGRNLLIAWRRVGDLARLKEEHGIA